MSGRGRECRFALQIEWRLCEPLPTKSLDAAKRRYVPKPDARDRYDATTILITDEIVGFFGTTQIGPAVFPPIRHDAGFM